MHTSTSIPIQHWLFRKVKQWFNQQKKQGQKSIKIKATPQTVIVCCTGKDSFHIKERNKSGCFVFCLYPWDHVRHIAVKSSYLNEYFPPLVHCISTKLLKVSKTVDAEKKKKKKKKHNWISDLFATCSFLSVPFWHTFEPFVQVTFLTSCIFGGFSILITYVFNTSDIYPGD